MMINSIVPITISCAAFIFSIFTWRERKSKDQLDLFLRINERLIDVDLQRGRRIIYRTIQSKEDVRSLLQDKPEDYDLANRALAMLNISALYVEQDFINRKLFLQQWGHVYARIWRQGQYFIEVRKEDNAESQAPLWPHFQSFAQASAAQGDASDELGVGDGLDSDR